MSGKSAEVLPWQPINEREFRNALGMFATGVAIVTGTDRDGRHFGMTINSFVAISLQPPLVAWSLSRTAPSAQAFTCADYFAVNVLAHNQTDLSRQFSRHGEDKFARTPMRVSANGLPLLEGAAAHFECRREQLHVAGDHTIVIGAVQNCTYRRCGTLIFAQGRYHRGVALELAAPSALEIESAWDGIA